MERGVDLLDRVGHGVGHRVDHLLLTCVAPVVNAERLHVGSDVFLLLHEAHEHVLVRQLLGEALCEETVEHVVVVHGRVGAYAFEATVVVSEHQSVG